MLETINFEGCGRNHLFRLELNYSAEFTAINRNKLKIGSFHLHNQTVLLTIITLLTTIQLQLTRADSSTFQLSDKFLGKCTKAQDSLNFTCGPVGMRIVNNSGPKKTYYKG